MGEVVLMVSVLHHKQLPRCMYIDHVTDLYVPHAYVTACVQVQVYNARLYSFGEQIVGTVQPTAFSHGM